MATLENIQARIKKLQTQAEALVAKRAQGALDQIRELMIKHGLTTEDIERRAKERRERERSERLGLTTGKVKSAKSATAVKGKLPPKYRDPKTGATWSGHARPPAWIKDAKDRSKFLIDSAAAGTETAATVRAVAKKAGKKAAAKNAVTAKPAAKKAAKKAALKSVGKKTAAKKTAAKKVAAKPAAPTVGKRAVAKQAAAKKTTEAKAPAKKAAAKKASVKTAPVKTAPPPVVETPVTVQTPETTGEA